MAFDLLAVDGEDIRRLPLHGRKLALRRIMPRIESRLRFIDHVKARGMDSFRVACGAFDVSNIEQPAQI